MTDASAKLIMRCWLVYALITSKFLDNFAVRFFVFRNLLNEAELQNVWKALLSNESVVKRAWDVSVMFIACVCVYIWLWAEMPENLLLDAADVNLVLVA